MFYRDTFSLSELCDVVWGLLRLKAADASRASLLSDDRLFAVFKRVEELTLGDTAGFRHLRPCVCGAVLSRSSKVANLAYCVSYSHYPARVPVCVPAGAVRPRLQRVAAAVCSNRYGFSLGEIATVFTAFAESGVAHAKLFRLLLKQTADRCVFSSSVTRSLPEATPKTALSLLYAYSRAVKQRLLPASDRSLVAALDKAIGEGVSAL